MSRKKLGIGILVIFGLTAAVYVPAMRAGFTWDDNTFLWENRLTKAPEGLYRFWFTSETPDYLPLTSSAFWLQWRLWGRDPAGYHVVNILLHAANAVLLWLVLRRLNVPGAWLAGLVFAVHPVNVASVAWISELKNTLSMFFYALAALLWLKFDDRGRRRWYALSVAMFLLALLSKTSVVMLPVALLACAWWRRGRIAMKDLLRSAPLFALSAAFGMVTIWFQHNKAIGEPIDGPEGIIERVALAGRAFWFYLSKALLPVNLSMIYPRWEVHASGAAALVPAALLVLAAGLLWQYRKRWARPPAFAMGYYFVTLLPVLGFLDMSFMMHSMVADHWHYVSIIAVIALVVGAAWKLAADRKGAIRPAAIAAAVLLVGTLSALTFRQASLYGDEITLWGDTLAKNPKAWAAHNNIGTALFRAGRTEDAHEHFLEALRLRPGHAESHNNVGALLARLGRLDEAIGYYRKAVALKPLYANARVNLGVALVKKKRFAEAAVHLAEALKLQPDNAKARFQLALAMAGQGRTRQAMEHYRRALRADPDWPAVLNNLAWIMATHPNGEFRDGPEAVRLARRACELTRHQRPRMLLTLAAALAEAGLFDQAVATARKAMAAAADQGQDDLAKELRLLIRQLKRHEPYRAAPAGKG